MNNIIKRVWNQNRMVNIEDLSGMAFQAEDGGHTFEISGVNDAGETVELSGTVAGVFMRPDLADIAIVGSATDGVVSVTLPADCYAVNGRFALTIFVTSDEQKVAVYAAVGTVTRTSGGAVAGDTPQDVVDLINAINTAVQSIPADYSDLMAAFAPTYSNSALYAKGAYAWYNGVLYKAVVDISTAESFTSAHWTAAVICDDLSRIGLDGLSINPYTNESWATGYIGSTKIVTTTSNGDVYSTNPVPVKKGDVISVKIAIALNSTGTDRYAYFYYAFCDALKKYTSRLGGSALYNDSDANYRYYKTTINVDADGYFICSYRPHSIAYETASSITITHTVTAMIGAVDDKVDLLAAEVEHGRYYEFPSNDFIPICVCHRGLATMGLPENTLTAFRDAKDKGWKWVETDIRMTSDGVWVCLHDESINRTARNADGTAISGTVNIADITYEQALEYDFGIYAGSQYAGTKILTLDDFVNYCQKAHLYAQIEVKSSAWSEAQMLTAWQLVEKYSMQNKVMFLCSSAGGLDDFVGFNPYLSVAFTGMPNSWTVIDPTDFGNTVPSGYSLKTGKNKLFLEPSQARFANLAAMENFIDYAHYWGCYAGVYGPVTESEINALSDRLDLVCSQYFKYNEVKEEEI